MGKRLVFITGNDEGQVGIVEWAVEGNLSMDTFDPVAQFEEAMEHHGRWDDFLDQPTESLIYVFYPDGNPGLIEFTTDVINKVGVPYRLSRVTRYQTAAGMMPVKEMDNGNDKKGL